MGRTNVIIQDSLIEEAMRITGAKTRKAVIALALQSIVEKNSLYRSLQKLRGQLTWTGDLEKSRKNRE